LKRIVAFLLLVALGGIPSVGDVRLRLSSGQELKGTDVRLDGGIYYLTTSDGGVMSFPRELVTSVELSGVKEEPPPAAEGEREERPTGLTTTAPRQLAGVPVTPPSPREQTEALGAPSKFQQGVFDPYWHPKNALTENPTDPHRNDFAPSEWSQSIIDPNWVPENAYPESHTQFAPSKFEANIIDPNWVPQDGFKKSQ
jgi:hypothetical protein